MLIFKGCRAFTLLEVVMVMVMVLMLSMIVMPQWIGFMHDWDLDMETREVVAKLREVQQNAITHGMPYRMVFDTINDGYTVEKYDGAYIPVEGPVAFENQIEVTTTYIPQFDKFGAPPNGGTITLTDGTNSNNILVKAVTGRIHVE